MEKNPNVLILKPPIRNPWCNGATSFSHHFPIELQQVLGRQGLKPRLRAGTDPAGSTVLRQGFKAWGHPRLDAGASIWAMGRCLIWLY